MEKNKWRKVIEHQNNIIISEPKINIDYNLYDKVWECYFQGDFMSMADEYGNMYRHQIETLGDTGGEKVRHRIDEFLIKLNKLSLFL